MQTQLVAFEVSLQTPPEKLRAAVAGSNLLRSDALRSHIESKLTEYGTPLRWAVTAVDKANQTAKVEAIVTTVT